MKNHKIILTFDCPHSDCEGKIRATLDDLSSMFITVCPSCKEVIGIAGNIVLPLDTQAWQADDHKEKTSDLKNKLHQFAKEKVTEDSISQITWQDITSSGLEPLKPATTEDLEKLDSSEFWRDFK